MDPAYGARYRDLYERHWWWRAREALIVELLERWAPAGGFGAILDVGCGDGLLFEPLRRFGEPQGVEVDAALVSADGRARGAIHVGPFDATFDPGRRFGLITLLDVIEHLDDDVGALRHAAELLDDGGLVVVTVPAWRLLWTDHDAFNQHVRRYSARALRRSLGAAGFAIRRLRFAFHWLVPLKLAVRLKEALVPAEPRIAEVPAPPINRGLRALCRLEQRTWGRLPWPFGTSLVAVACRAGAPRPR